MTPAVRNTLILVLALLAGVVTQEAVQKLTEANDEPEQAALACPDLTCPAEYANADAQPRPAEPPACDMSLVEASPETELPSVAADCLQDAAEPTAEIPSSSPDPAPVPPEMPDQRPLAAITGATEPAAQSVPHPEPAKSEIRIIPPPSTEALLVDKTEAAPLDKKPPLSTQPAGRLPKYPVPPSASASSALTGARLPSPEELVRGRAIARDVERRKRIEFRKALGYVPLRPAISANVHMGGSNGHPTVLFLPYVVSERRDEPSLGAFYLDSSRRD